MDRIKKVFYRTHMVFWTLVSLMVVLQLRGERQAHWLSIATGFIGTCLYVFYGNFYLLARHTGKRKRRGYWLPLAGIIATAPSPFWFFHRHGADDRYYTLNLAVAVLLFAFLGWLAWVTEHLVLNTVRKEQLEKEAVASELYYLRSQLAPHFLFNTLNNIHALVYQQSPAAPDAVMQLSSLMRYMIYESNAPTVPLTRELAYLQDYMNLQQLRYKERPVVELQIAGVPETCHIAPLLFIHLLENAYKHSPARLKPGDLKVRVAVQDDILTFSVENPMVRRPFPDALEEPGGIGLPNVRKRLALLYPGRHTLDIQSEGDTFSAVLRISGLQSASHEGKAHLLYH